jgi:predicted deacylase
MIDVAAAFSESYAEARGKFVHAAAGRAHAVASHVHPQVTGRDGEPLAVAVALLGAVDASALLVVSSGMHGVEGFAGSGCQVARLRDALFAAALAQSGVAALFVHAVNPFGFSHLRRANEDNVDVNRNFRDFAGDEPCNAAYRDVHRLVVPETWPPPVDNEQAIGAYVARHGLREAQAALTSGQNEFADGLFYSGRAPTWSNRTLREILAAHGAGRAAIGWIDLHTGLGPWAYGEKICNGPDDAATIARARRWFGGDVTTMYDGSSSSASLTGVSYRAALQACPQAQFTGLTLEFGTKPWPEVLAALRAEQWLVNHPDAGEALRHAIKVQMRDAFYVDRDDWKAMVLAQARVAVIQGLRGLGENEAIPL